MIFTRLGSIVVVLALILGIRDVVGWLAVVEFGLRPEEYVFGRYFPTAMRSSGERGIYLVLFAIALGILTEISRSVRAAAEAAEVMRLSTSAQITSSLPSHWVS
jgi:hypothetical protein